MGNATAKPQSSILHKSAGKAGHIDEHKLHTSKYIFETFADGQLRASRPESKLMSNEALRTILPDVSDEIFTFLWQAKCVSNNASKLQE